MSAWATEACREGPSELCPPALRDGGHPQNGCEIEAGAEVGKLAAPPTPKAYGSDAERLASRCSDSRDHRLGKEERRPIGEGEHHNRVPSVSRPFLKIALA